MTSDQARDILSHIVAQRIRWGQQYDASDIGIEKITDALIAIAQEEDTETGELRKSLAKANRQVGAANARETKLKAKNADLAMENKILTEALHDVKEGVED